MNEGNRPQSTILLFLDILDVFRFRVFVIYLPLLADCGDADVGMAPGAAHQRALLRASTSELELVEMTQLTKQELRNGGTGVAFQLIPC